MEGSVGGSTNVCCIIIIHFLSLPPSHSCREYGEMTSVRYVDFDRPVSLLNRKEKTSYRSHHKAPPLTSMEAEQQ